MATEIERKFLVAGDGWRSQVEASIAIRQAYLSLTDAMSIRVRIVDDAKALLTIKSAQPGPTRSEFEYAIPVEDAQRLLELRMGLVIAKRRYHVPEGPLTWEIDVFEGAHRGLVIAEIELPDAATPFARPDWLGREVTDDARYYNARLATHRVDG